MPTVSPSPENPINRQFRLAAVALATAAAVGQAHALDTFQAGGADAASLQGTVDAFRTALGGALNSGVGPFTSGRREINWDAVPDNLSDPNLMPADQFNGPSGGRARGIQFKTAGTGFKTSADSVNPTATAATFGFTEFTPFSAERIFAPLGSNVMDANFFVPGSITSSATITGFGAVFLGVENDAAAFIQAFDPLGTLIGSVSAPIGAFSFAALWFGNGERIGSVRITSGTLAIDGLPGTGSDFVAMDDFFYSEPLAAVPEPGTYALLATGLAIGAGIARRRRSGG